MRDLNLNLEPVAAPGISPEIQIGVPARRGRRDERPRHIRRRDAKLSRAIAVDLDLERRIIERLRILQVAQRIDLEQLGSNLLRERTTRGELRTLYGDFDRRRRAKAHDLADDVGGLERDRHIGQRLLQLVPELFLEFLRDWRRARLQRHSDHGLVLTAGKEVDGVDRIVRRLHPDEPRRDLDVLRTNQILDDVHRLQFNQLGALEPRAGWRTEAELNLLGFYFWKNLCADPGEQDRDHDEGRQHIASDDEPSQAKGRFESTAIRRPQLLEESSFSTVSRSQHPGR